MRIIIGSDHAGFDLKEAIRAECSRLGVDLTDAGPASAASVDYPDFGAAVAGRVAAGEFDRGILICGSGIGMSITANKFRGIRAGLCFTPEMAELSRRHNDTNILVLPGRFVSVETGLAMVRAGLDAPFDGGRHARRLEKIRLIEERQLGNRVNG